MIREKGEASRRFGFPREVRLKKRREFLAVQRTGHRQFTQHFIVIISTGDNPHARLGVTASKRVGNAVIRNRWKRVIREAFRRLHSALELGQEIVIIARQGERPPSLDQALRELRTALTPRDPGVRRRGQRSPSRSC